MRTPVTLEPELEAAQLGRTTGLPGALGVVWDSTTDADAARRAPGQRGKPGGRP